jgi:hypothetical protein
LNGNFVAESNGQIPGLGQRDTTALPSPGKVPFSSDKIEKYEHTRLRAQDSLHELICCAFTATKPLLA